MTAESRYEVRSEIGGDFRDISEIDHAKSRYFRNIYLEILGKFDQKYFRNIYLEILENLTKNISAKMLRINGMLRIVDFPIPYSIDGAPSDAEQD